MVTLVAENLRKTYGRTVAVDSVSFEIPEGALVTFLGPSGCGKTTTLRMVAGLEKPDSGLIKLGADVVYDSASGVAVPAERREIGMVFQSYAIWPHMTVANNVAFPLKIRRMPSSDIARLVTDALKLVQLDAYADRYPSQLSGGQQQRVALARAIVFQPRILLLDEPLSNLDAKLREEMRGEIRDLQLRLGITTLFVTHDQDEALSLSDLVAVMHEGRIVQVGGPREIYEHPKTRFVANFVGWTNFLSAELIDRKTARVQGKKFEVAGKDLNPGGAVHLAIRPEDVLVEENQTSISNVLDGRVRTSMFMGSYTVVEIEVDGSLLIAHAPPQTNLRRGDSVRALLPRDRLLVLSA
ncbi:MAG: ABC transporter ATP-binding protein [Proteobacteria bacterium]|nr:ABC transporter ATP-binding protein [Pseudomonadota bacterium]